MADPTFVATTEQKTSPHETKWLGETPAFWSQTGVLLLGALIAAIAILSAKAVERKKAAIGVIFASRRDKELIEALRTIAKLHEGAVNLATFGKNSKVDSDESKTIRYALNHYEYVSVGISEGIFDERIFKSASFSTITKLYKHTKPFIDEVRSEKKKDTAWQEFECLAVKWNHDALQAKPIVSAPPSNGFLKRLKWLIGLT